MGEREHKVWVGGESHSVTVFQKSKTAWEAVGDYMEETIRVQDRTAGAAIKRWRGVATYKEHGEV
jgi:hypothetical protein